MRRRGLDSAPISSCAIAGNPGHNIPIIVVVCIEPRLPTDLQQQQQRRRQRQRLQRQRPIYIAILLALLMHKAAVEKGKDEFVWRTQREGKNIEDDLL